MTSVVREERVRSSHADEVSRQKRQTHCGWSAKTGEIDVGGWNATALSQLITQLKSVAGTRQLQPDLMESLGQALSKIDITKQVVLKTFDDKSTAHQLSCADKEADVAASFPLRTMQHSVESLLSGAGGKASVSLGDCLVLHQSPLVQATVLPATSNKSAQKEQGASAEVASKQTADASSSSQPGSEACNSPQSTKPCKPSSLAGSSSSDEGPDRDSLWDAPPSVLIAEVQALRKHKEWADQKIDYLIRRVREAEAPHKILKEEVHQLRMEKNSVESKLKDFETSLQKLKDCTYTEASQRRDVELNLRNAQAELRGSNLREQELQLRLQEAQQALRQEKKKRETTERKMKKTLDDLSDIQGIAQVSALALSKQTQEVEETKRRFQEQQQEVERCRQAAMLSEQQACASKQGWKEIEQELSACRAQAAAREGELEGIVSALNSQLDLAAATQAAPQRQPQPSFYSHFGGADMFQGGVQWLQNAGLAVHLDGMTAEPRCSSALGSPDPLQGLAGSLFRGGERLQPHKPQPSGTSSAMS